MDKLKKVISVTMSIVIFFTIIFSLFDYTHWTGLNKKDDSNLQDRIFNRLYFTMTTFSSTGYGDITPKSKELKMVVMLLQLLLTVAILEYLV